MRINSETVVGVVGAKGDLGRQVSSIVAERGFRVLRTDRVKLLAGTTLDKVMDQSDFVHFCIPEDGFEGQYELRDGQTGIIHHSVMHRSMEINDTHFSGQADVAHMLMNEAAKNNLMNKILRLINSIQHGFRIYPSSKGTVVVEQNTPNLERVKGHMALLGLRPIAMKAQDHDTLSAMGQGWQALGVLELLPQLKLAHENGLLTPSAIALLEGLSDRSAKWTAGTLDSILDNPELPVLLNRLLELLAERGNS